MTSSTTEIVSNPEISTWRSTFSAPAVAAQSLPAIQVSCRPAVTTAVPGKSARR